MENLNKWDEEANAAPTQTNINRDKAAPNLSEFRTDSLTHSAAAANDLTGNV